MTGQEDVLNQAEALSLTDGDRELLIEVVNIFLEDYPRLCRNAHQALAEGDAKTLERVAHTVRGSVANFGAKPSIQAAHRLEQLSKSGDLSGAAPALAELERQLALLRPALEEMIAVQGESE